MTTSCEVFGMVDHLASLSGNSQQEQLAKYMEKSELFVRVCKAALDPFVTYGIKTLDLSAIDPSSEKPSFDHDTWSLLDSLANRSLTGGAAISAVCAEMSLLPSDSAVLLERIVKKDLRAGFSAKSLNRHKPGTIFIFDCMLAHKFDESRIKSFPVAVEPKFDGVRALAIYKNGSVGFYSRTGKEFPNYGHIGEQLKSAITEYGLKDADMIFDGEIMDGSFADTVGSMRRDGADTSNATYHVFEIMSLSAFNEGSGHPYVTRRTLVQRLIDVIDMPNVEYTESRLANSVEEIMEWADELQAAGGEGVIVKELGGCYERKRSHAWMKVKGHISHDLVVTGFFEGEGKYKGSLGGIYVDLNGVRVGVGSGLTDDMRNEIWADQDYFVGRLAEISGHELTPDGSIRHPVFKRFRDDKPAHDGIGS